MSPDLFRNILSYDNPNIIFIQFHCKKGDSAAVFVALSFSNFKLIPIRALEMLVETLNSNQTNCELIVLYVIY